MLRSEIDGIPLEGDVGFRQRAVEPDKTALLVIDLQKGEYNAEKSAAAQRPAAARGLPGGGDRGDLHDHRIPHPGWQGSQPGLQDLRHFRRQGLVASPADRRAQPAGKRDALPIDELSPLENEIFIPKTSSSVFNSTNIEYVLRNLGIEYILVMGIVTDQCVETAVRDGCDRGFLMTLIDDACATHTQERHEFALRALKGYCRVRSTDALIDELQQV
jgi:nicotinamidase-related amidase